MGQPQCEVPAAMDSMDQTRSPGPARPDGSDCINVVLTQVGRVALHSPLAMLLAAPAAAAAAAAGP